MGRTKSQVVAEKSATETAKATPRKTATKKSETLYESLLKFQSEMPALIKNTQGYGYTYVDIGEILRVVQPLLAKYNMGVIQPLCEDGIKTVLYHTVSGEALESYTKIPQGVEMKGMNAYQSYGSAITYFRRYSLSAMLGIISDKDEDARGEQVKSITSKRGTKPGLNAESFQRALAKIALGEYEAENLRANFQLTSAQVEELNKV